MSITIKDNAREAGISNTTMSRALHNHAGILSPPSTSPSLTWTQMLTG